MENNYDRFYIKGYDVSKPKESFKFIAEIFKRKLKNSGSISVADIGCAKGDFIYFLNTLELGKGIEYYGFDIDDVLLNVAKENLMFAKFGKCNIVDRNTLPQKKFDYVFMNGVTGYFDTLDVWVKNFVAMLNDGGTGFVYGTFNEDDVDVLVKLRNASGDSDFFTWGNIFSLTSIKKELNKLNHQLNVYPFNINIDVAKNTEDPIRSWTFKDENGKRITKNGAQIIQNYFLLEISKKQ